MKERNYSRTKEPTETENDKEYFKIYYFLRTVHTAKTSLKQTFETWDKQDEISLF
jgi:hypothetical protein